MDTIVIKKSELIEQIREDFKLWEEMSPDIDEGKWFISVYFLVVHRDHRISTKAILMKRTYSLI